MTNNTIPPLVPHGRGTADVLPILQGHLALGTRADWIATDDESDVRPPVLCFVVRHDGEHYLWDLGMRPDLPAVNEATRTVWRRGPPTIHRALPAALAPSLAPKAIYLSHYHWDHAGDVTTIAPGVPVFVGAGTLAGIRAGGLGKHVGNVGDEYLARLTELPAGEADVAGLAQGVDVFGDGSFVVVSAPGHCPGHSVAVVRTSVEPDTYVVLGGDSGHDRALYSPCPCHGTRADFGRRSLHADPAAARATLTALSSLHERDDTWVVLAHEAEAEGVLFAASNGEGEWIGDWKRKGLKEAVENVRVVRDTNADGGVKKEGVIAVSERGPGIPPLPTRCFVEAT